MMGETRLHGEKYHPEEVCQELIFFIVEPPYSIRAERRAIDAVIQNNPKARANPKALAQLAGYKRPLVSSFQVIFSGSAWKEWPKSNRFRRS